MWVPSAQPQATWARRVVSQRALPSGRRSYGHRSIQQSTGRVARVAISDRALRERSEDLAVVLEEIARRRQRLPQCPICVVCRLAASTRSKIKETIQRNVPGSRLTRLHPRHCVLGRMEDNGAAPCARTSLTTVSGLEQPRSSSFIPYNGLDSSTESRHTPALWDLSRVASSTQPRARIVARARVKPQWLKSSPLWQMAPITSPW